MRLFNIEHLENRLHLAAQAYDWRNVTMKGTGFINGVVFSPAQPGLMYANTDMGGAYRFDQSTNKWAPLTDWIQGTDWSVNYNGAETVAVDPTDANKVYLGLGTYYGPSAVLRSSDQGRTWLRANVPWVMNGNGPGRNAGQRMMVDPNSPNVIYYATRRNGIYRTTDSGANWSKLNGFTFTTDASGPTLDVGTDWLVIDKSSGSAGNVSQVLYAGAATTGATKIWRSTDGGTTWTGLPGQVLTANNQFPLRAALTPDGNTLYLTYGVGDVGPNGVTGGFVYKVTNPKTASPTWASIAPALSQGGWSGVTLDPVNPNTLFISTIDSWGPIDDIYRSTNAGGSWTKLGANSHRNNTSAPFASGSNIHWTGDVQLDPFDPNHVIFNTGFGFYASTNAMGATPTWSFFNNGIEQSAVSELASPNTGAVNLLSAIGDLDGFRHVDFSVSPTAGKLGQSQGLAVGSNDDIDVAWNDANYLVRATHTSPYVQYSLNNGVTWAWFPSAGVSGGGAGSGRVAISADGTKTVYEPDGTGQTIYSTRTGSTWSSWSVPVSGRPANGARIVADLVDPTTFYAYVGTTLSRSVDGGANWTTMTTTAPGSGAWLRAVPNNAGHLLLTTGGNGLWRSTNGGANWTRINSAAVTTANEVGVGAAAPGQSYPAIFIGGTLSGQNGFFRSDDQGATWTMVSDIAHQYGDVTVIQGDPRVYGRLYVGTNGRGILYADIHNSLTTLPAGWNTQDIGSVGSVGSAGANGGTFEVVGGGGGIGTGGADAFRFAYTTLDGDGSITARVVSNPLASPANNLAKAGVMIRNNLTAASAEAYMAMTPGAVNGAVFYSRGSAGGGATTNYTGVWNPYWVRLTRSGNSFTAERSSDGATWVQVGTTQTIAMNATVNIGLAVTASDNGQVAIATFDNVSIVASNAVAITGTNSSDTIRLVRNGATTEVWLNGSIVRTFDPATATDVSIDALDGDDTITLDFSAGSPVPIVSSIDGNAGNDTIATIGSASADTITFITGLLSVAGVNVSHTNIETRTLDGLRGGDHLTIGDGVIRATATQALASLSITSGATLDLDNHDLILDYIGETSPLAGVVDQIRTARASGTWTGSGINSSAARTNASHNTTLGAMESANFKAIYGDAATFGGESIDATAVLVKYTYYGDTDFNGVVNFDDYSRTDAGFNSGRSGWLNGDFDENGVVNFDDYSLIDLAFNTQAAPLRHDPRLRPARLPRSSR